MIETSDLTVQVFADGADIDGDPRSWRPIR